MGGKLMKTFLFDYYFLDQQKRRIYDYYETFEVEADNYEDAEIKLYRSRGDVEIVSTFWEEEN